MHVVGLDGERASVGHRVARVDDEIDDDLFELPSIGANARQVRRCPDHELDVFADRS